MNQWQFFMQPMIGQNMNNNNFNWKFGYVSNNIINNPIQFNNNQIFRMNFVFKTTHGNSLNLLFDPEKTVEDLILTFFRRVDNEKLFYTGGVTFIHNATEVSYHIKTKVKDFFRGNANPCIMVIDINNLIGA